MPNALINAKIGLAFIGTVRVNPAHHLRELTHTLARSMFPSRGLLPRFSLYLFPFCYAIFIALNGQDGIV